MGGTSDTSARTWRRAVTALALVATSVAVGVGPRAPLAGAATPDPAPGAGTAHPRLLYDPGSEALLQDRLTREPYRSLFINAHNRADSLDNATLGDPGINAQRDLTRAAKTRAFEYALNRTVVGGTIVPFAAPADREATGAFVRDVLLQVYDRSRVAVPPPIGGWDRDISTSEEMVNAAQSFDGLLAGGFDLGADRTEIVRRLTSVTDELWRNYTDLSTAGGVTALHQNNHRTKSGAAMAMVAIVLVDDVPAEQSRRWFDTGADYVDDLMRHTLITGDGAYGEGAFYYRYTLMNLLPYLAAWERFLGDAPWTTTDGLEVPALAHEPLFARTQRWMLDMTLPDGSLAPIDDGNPGRSNPFGALPSGLPTAAASAWRWANAPTPFEIDGNVDLTVDSIVAYDDGIAPAEPAWSPTQFYVEGGNAILKSSWAPDATEALILGEHDTASEFGRDRTGTGRFPQSHEHADPGSFLLQAFGERLALDPGYLNFTTHADVNQPEDHNTVLVDGKGPADYLTASFDWEDDPTGRPPAEGQSTIAHTLDSSAADAATVVTAYQGAQIERRFLLGEDRYLIVADHVDAPAGTELTWMLHGNGGGTSGGTFAPTADGGTWTIGGGRLSSAIDTSGGAATLSTIEGVHELAPSGRATHSARAADATAAARADGTAGADALQVLYPTGSGTPAPVIHRSGTDGTQVVEVEDATDDRRVVAVEPAEGSSAEGAGARAGNGLLVVDRHVDGTLRSAFADGTTSLELDDGPTVHLTSPGTIAVKPGDGRLDVVATGSSPTVAITGSDLDVQRIDGVCGVERDGDTLVITLNRERRVTLRSDAGGSRPGADAGPDQRVEPGAMVPLDGGASCDFDGSSLTHRWELVSAPAGSAWSLQGANSATPMLSADRVGPYRIRLVVTDRSGTESFEQEVVVVAGPVCGDGVDNDLDGTIDDDDPNCDGAEVPPTTTTTTTSTPTSSSTTSTSTTGSTTTTSAPRPTTDVAPAAEAIPGQSNYTG